MPEMYIMLFTNTTLINLILKMEKWNEERSGGKEKRGLNFSEKKVMILIKTDEKKNYRYII